MKTLKLIALMLLITSNYAYAQESTTTLTNKKQETMNTYVIERIIPGAGALTQEQLKGISQTSCTVLEEMGPQIAWLRSYVTGDKVYCVYKAINKALVEEHAKKGGFPANAINQVATVISPTTAKQ